MHEIDKRFGDLKWCMTTILAIATAILSGLIIYAVRRAVQLQKLKQMRVDLREIASALYVADPDTKKKFREALNA